MDERCRSSFRTVRVGAVEARQAARGAAAQEPLDGAHDSHAGHVTAEPTHAPATQASPVVQACPSLHPVRDDRARAGGDGTDVAGRARVPVVTGRPHVAGARGRLSAALEARLDRAGQIAAVTARVVPVVARLARVDHTVAARRARPRHVELEPLAHQMIGVVLRSARPERARSRRAGLRAEARAADDVCEPRRERDIEGAGRTVDRADQVLRTVDGGRDTRERDDAVSLQPAPATTRRDSPRGRQTTPAAASRGPAQSHRIPPIAS